MFPSNAAAAKRLGKRKVREVGRETAAPAAPFNLHGHHLASTSDGRRSQVQKVLNNAAAAASPLKPSFSFMALLTANDDEEEDDYAYECCPMAKDIKNQSDPINQMNQMIMFHNENLRQSVVGMFEKHNHSLHHAAEERVAKRLKETTERNAELERRNAELERLTELFKGEAERLLLRVRYLEANAARHYAETVEEEAESSFEDPDRVGPVRLDCKVCERQLATMMVWPCRHVCVCTACDAATKRCPVCRSVKTTSVELCLPLD